MSMRSLFPTVLALALLHVGALHAEPGCEPSVQPGCGGCLCQACVCGMDPFCCTSAWDPMCVTRCTDLCGGCGAAAPCGDGVCAPSEGCGSCPADCGDCPVPCGEVTVKGCCSDGTLAKCVDGALQVTDCDGSCGWSLESKTYVCGGAGPDPTGVSPLQCPAPVTEDVSVEWPEVCEGVTWEGCCKGTTLFWCDGLGLQSLPCGNNPAPLATCGWTGGADGQYDCGGQGSDPAGTWDLACDEGLGEIVEPPPEDECTVGETIQVGCGGVSFSGCCTDGKDLVFCEGGELLCALHCAQLPSPLNTCGWKLAGETGFYDCGGDGIDPSGQNPIYCPDWTPDEDIVVDGGGDIEGPWGCPELPVGGCCDGAVLHTCKDGSDAAFDCASLAADPVFGDYVHCGLDEASGAVSCLKKDDPTAPSCDLPVEPIPDAVEPPPSDVVEDTGSETVDGVTMDHVGDGAGIDVPRDGLLNDRAGADTPWTWPDLDTGLDGGVDTGGGSGGGGKGCAAGAAGGAASPLLLLLFAALMIIRRRAKIQS